MTYKGRVKNGVVVVDPPAKLPEGELVEIVLLESTSQQTGRQDPGKPETPRNLYEELGDIVGSIHDLPSDASEQVDHYLYGSPKR